MTRIPLYQWTPYERVGVNGLCAGFTVDGLVHRFFLSARLTKISLIFLVGALCAPTPS
jgi:hypothetical protein